MRHIRAMCRGELALHGESEQVGMIIAELSQRLFDNETPQDIEELAERLTAAIFRDYSA